MTTKSNPTSENLLRRYTNLASLIHILQTKKITLLDPENWEDKNDSYFIRKYKERKNLKSVLAICFTNTGETHHHWKIFSGGVDGVCIILQRDSFVERMEKQRNVKFQEVKYKLVRTLKKRAATIEALPFTKRYPFRAEKEHRLIYTSKTEEIHFKDFDFDISDISRIVLSPWMHASLRDSVKKTLKSIPGCANLTVTKSTLIGHTEWMQMADRAK